MCISDKEIVSSAKISMIQIFGMLKTTKLKKE